MKAGFLLAASLSLAAAATVLGATDGSVEFTATTKPTTGDYAPRHVMAIWVTDSKGACVRTLEVYGQKYSKHLKTWARQSKASGVDAVTGATLKTHRTHTVTWDCRDAKGAPVPDGEYQVHVELTERNGQGPVTPPGHMTFTKGPQAATVTPKELPFLTQISLKYSPREAAPASTSTKEKQR